MNTQKKINETEVPPCCRQCDLCSASAVFTSQKTNTDTAAEKGLYDAEAQIYYFYMAKQVSRA